MIFEFRKMFPRIGNLIRHYRSLSGLIDVAKPVAAALAENKPVVALETTILTHGMPFPTNIQIALAVENLIKEQGAIPATIGVVNGRIKVGLDEKSLTVLASPDTESVKISRRDFPVVISRGLSGGTTVSGTLLVSKLVGIDIFVTGGIGGVHRDVSETMDISADLLELSRSPIMVVSSGVKSILDIGRTLEYLETLGVCVVTYDDSKDFPAFYTRKSGYQSVYNVTNPQQAAELLFNVKELELQSGILLGVPLPEEYSFNEQDIQNAIEKALKYCKEKGISGKFITPFILDQVSKITEGRSLDSNIALIKNNAVVGSKIAVALKKKTFLESSSSFSTFHRKYSIRVDNNVNKFSSKKVIVIGGSNMDIIVRPDESLQLNGGTQPGMVKLTAGGVARNIADALGKLLPDTQPTFISAIGNDSMGHLLWKSIEHVDSDHVIKNGTQNSSSCLVLLDQQRDCSVIVGDMAIHGCITSEEVLKHEEIFENCGLIVMDGNLSADTISCILTLAGEKNVPVWFEPTDHSIATRPFESNSSPHRIQYCSPNLQELQKIVSYLTKTPISTITLHQNSINEVITEARDLSLRVLPTVPNIMVTLSKYGLLMVTLKQDKPKATFYKAIELNSIENVSGVGDCLASGYIAAMLNGCEENECVHVGLNAAVQSLLSLQTVPDDLRYETIKTPVSSIELPITGEINVN